VTAPRCDFMRLIAVAAGHAFIQNLRRGHYAISTDLPIPDEREVVRVG
jgi:hypothetical protein